MSKRFRVAFSFAGEKRDLVGKAAELIAQRFGEVAVLYDKFHAAEFARDDLGSHLTRLYREESDLIVVVICSDYQTKEWPGLEWSAIFDVIRNRPKGEKNAVMLCRFDLAIVEGLDPLAGFFDLDEATTPEKFATLILQRLALNEGKKRDYYLNRSKRNFRPHLVRFGVWCVVGLVPLLGSLGFPLLFDVIDLYPESGRSLLILLSALVMGVMGVIVHFVATRNVAAHVITSRFRRAATVFASAFVALLITYHLAVVHVAITQPNHSVRTFAYVTGGSTVPSNKSPDCECKPGTSAQECVKGDTSDEAIAACFGANRVLFAKLLLALLYLVATGTFTPTVGLGVLALRIPSKQAVSDSA